MRTHRHLDVQVAGPAAILARGTLAFDTDALAVLHAGRNADLHGLGGLRATRSVAHLAGILDNHASPLAIRAGLSHLEDATRRGRVHTRSLTGRAHSRHGSGPGTSSPARLAGGLGDHVHGDGRPGHGVVEGNRRLPLDVGTTTSRPGRGAASTGGPEEISEEVSESVAVGGGTNEVLDVDVRLSATTREPESAGRSEEAASLVVFLTLLGIGQHVVGLGGLLETSLGSLVTGVGVGMVVPGDLAERLLDLLGLRVLGDTEDLVVVLLGPVLGTHLVPPSLIIAGSSGLRS